MGTNNGKFFDAKLSGEYYDILLDAKKSYDKKADGVRDANDDFEANDRFTGDSATGLKKFIKYGTGNMVNDQTDLYNQLITVQADIMQAFADKVDGDANARIEYDTLEKINTDFKGFYSVFDENANAVYNIVNDLNNEFGGEIDSGFSQPNSKTGRERYINICGGDDSGAGYFKDCQDKLVNFDAEMKQYLDSKNIPFIYDDITRRVKATSSILGGYHYDSPEFDGKKELVIDTPRVKAIKEVDLGFDNFCSDIDKLLDKRNTQEIVIDPVTGFPVNSFRCSFDQLEKSDDPLVKRTISSPHYRTFKQMVMETSKPLPDDPNTYMITPKDVTMALGVGGAVKSYKELGNLSELQKNAKSNYAAFKDGGVDYMVNYVAGQNAIPATLGTATGSEAAVMMNLLNTSGSSANTLPAAGTVPGLLAGANPAVVNSQIANLWNIIGQGMGNQNPAAYMNALYKKSGAVALMSCTAAGAKSSGKAVKKEFATDQELAKYLDEQFGQLCDDNDSNDKEAAENIDACMGNFICEKEVDGKKYVAYDHDKIRETLKYLDKDGLAYDLLSSVHNRINENEHKGVAVPTAIIELEKGGKLENTQLHVKKDGAGVRLEVTSNNDWLPGKEIKKEPVAYACTEESAENYFMTNGEYDWDAIEAWYKAEDDFNDDYHYTSKEYDVLAIAMQNMSDKEIEQLLEHACYSAGNFSGSYTLSEKLGILSERHQMHVDVSREVGNDKIVSEKDYARAILVKNLSDRMRAIAGYEHNLIPKISYDEEKKAYTGVVNDYLYESAIDNNPFEPRNDQKVVVYETGAPARVEQNLDDVVDGTIAELAPGIDLKKETTKYVFEQVVSIVYEKYDIDNPSEPIISNLKELEKSYEASIMGEGARKALAIGNSIQCMEASGPIVHISDKNNNTSYIYNPQYDDKKLVFNVAAYNKATGSHYTIADMKKEYMGNTEEFKKYQEWYTDNNNEILELIRETDEIKGRIEVNSMSAEQLEIFLSEE